MRNDQLFRLPSSPFCFSCAPECARNLSRIDCGVSISPIMRIFRLRTRRQRSSKHGFRCLARMRSSKSASSRLIRRCISRLSIRVRTGIASHISRLWRLSRVRALYDDVHGHAARRSGRMVAAARDIPEPTDGNFAAYLEPNKLVPLTGRIAEVSANLAEIDVTPLQQARVDYEYVTSIMKYDKSGPDGAAATRCTPATYVAATAPIFIRCLSDWRAPAESRRGLRLAFRSARRNQATSPVTTAGRSSIPAECGAGRCVRGVEAS